ncbi:MAG: serine/threonine protein kinase, partial [Halobacteria archaeon]|nr:serine/threonine protein kinase [Halobacteria archaeon]
MNVLGIEGTAWNASAAVFDSDAEEIVSHVSEPYVPDEGGIHPREASEHISSSVVDVVGDALEDAGIEDGDEEVDAVA